MRVGWKEKAYFSNDEIETGQRNTTIQQVIHINDSRALVNIADDQSGDIKQENKNSPLNDLEVAKSI